MIDNLDLAKEAFLDKIIKLIECSENEWKYEPAGFCEYVFTSHKRLTFKYIKPTACVHRVVVTLFSSEVHNVNIEFESKSYSTPTPLVKRAEKIERFYFELKKRHQDKLAQDRRDKEAERINKITELI